MFFVHYIQIFPYNFLAHKPVTAVIVHHNEVKIRTEAASNTKVLDTFINRTCIDPQNTRHTFHLCGVPIDQSSS